MIEVARRLISFKFSDAPDNAGRIWLRSSSGTWNVRGALTPDVNVATCVYTEFAKLPANLRDLEGTIELWSTVPTELGTIPPDVALEKQTLADVRKGRQGIVAGETTMRVIEYELSFA